MLTHGRNNVAATPVSQICEVVKKFKHCTNDTHLPQMSWSDTLELTNFTCETML